MARRWRLVMRAIKAGLARARIIGNETMARGTVRGGPVYNILIEIYANHKSYGAPHLPDAIS